MKGQAGFRLSPEWAAKRGTAAGVINRRYRGALVILALSLVLACLCSVSDHNAVVVHRLVPPYVLLAMTKFNGW